MFTDENITKAVQEFHSLTSDHNAHDTFFEKYGVGNDFTKIHAPHERFCNYESLMERLHKEDSAKYQQLHKGTPFYFLFWTAYDSKNYEKALFYLDAAISDDTIIDPNGWSARQAGNYFWLKNTGLKAAGRAIDHTRFLIEAQLTRFNKISGVRLLQLDADFINKFVKQLAMDKRRRSVITALYTFVVEFEERHKELVLRSKEGGSIEPALTHLFKGGLVFESLLKICYPTQHNGTPTKTLGSIFSTQNFQTDFALFAVNTSSTSLNDILNHLGTPGATDKQKAFDVASMLRNTTGHNLVWDDVFSTAENYRRFFEQQMNAIFYVIEKKFC